MYIFNVYIIIIHYERPAMIRTQIYLTASEKRALRKLSAETGEKQSELIRRAVDRFISDNRSRDRLALLRKARGLWKDRKDLPDFEDSSRNRDRTVRGIQDE
jgi:hypothetical protein